MKDNIKEFLKNFVNTLSLENIDTVHHDSIRKKDRIEILAALLIAATEQDNKELSDKVFSKIRELQLNSSGFDEKFYGNHDENVGSYGAIPTSFVAIAACKYIHTYFPNNYEYNRWLLKLGDFIYSVESEGAYLKGTLNRSKALNTDLFMSYSLYVISKNLSNDSVRRRMYEEATRRTIWRIMKYQFSNGSFPYQSYTFKVPFLYHIVVTSLLKNFAISSKDEMITSVYNKAVKFINSNIFNGRDINWEKANDKDKEGAIWAYSFLLNIYPRGESHSTLIDILEKHFEDGFFYSSTLGNSDKNVDKFYSAWVIISLDHFTYDEVENKKYKFNIFLFLNRQILNIQALYRYVKQRLLNTIYNTGAHENKNPHD
tara:strand:+ start:8722 stop:9837 length:1116 start_codon:yes stop_codon:yes gene_type:complete